MFQKIMYDLTKQILNLLKAKNSNKLTYCISFLSLIKSHPHYLDKQKFILQSYKKKLFLILREAYNHFRLFYFFFEKQMIINNKHYKYVFVSHYLNKKQNIIDDINYGNVFKNFSKNSLIILINHTNHFEKSSYKNVIILNRRLSLLKEFYLIKKLYTERLKFIKLFNKKKKYIYRVVAGEAISPSTVTNLRIGYQIETIIDKIKPNLVVTTFEGYSWEKYVINAAKERNINIYGYIPNLFAKNTGSNLIVYKQEYFPNKLLVLGNKSKKIAIQNGIKEKNIKIIGSHKNFPKIYKLTQKKKLNLLVIPEGIDSEVNILFNFLNNKEMESTEFSILLRLHPVLNKKDYVEKLKKKILIKNLYISNSSLENDLRNSKFVLFRGSNLILNCVANKLVPIYYQTTKEKKNKINISPISSKNFFFINKTQDLLRIIRYKKKYPKRINIKEYVTKLNLDKIKNNE